MAGRAGSWGADLRLAGPAVCAWMTGGFFVVSPRGSGMVAMVCGGVGVVAVSAAIVVRTRPAVRRAFVTIGVCLAGSALVAMSIVLQTAYWAGPDLHRLADAHRSIDARVEISRPATQLTSPDRFTGEDKYLVHARLTHAAGGGDALELDAPIVIFAGQHWAELPPGTVATGRLRLSPAKPGRRSAATCRPHGPPRIVTEASGVQATTASLRIGLREASAGLPTDARGLLPGLVDGDTSNVPNSLDQDMKDTGLSHLVAVSGSNLGILSGAVLVFGVLVRLPRRLQLAGAAAVLVGYVLVVGPDPSVLRSAIMAWLALLGLLSGRSGRGLPALSLAVLVLLVADPWFGRDFGFALSVLACVGLLVCVRPWVAALSRVMPRYLAFAVAVPAAAQAFCAPVILLMSPRVALYAVPANLAAAPAVAPATVFGVMAMPVAAVWPAAARFLAWWAGLGASWIAGVARFFAGLPAATVSWPDGVPGAALLIVATLLGCGVAGLALRSRWSAAVTAAAAALLIAAAWWPVSRWPDRWLPQAAPVVICDVGQGSGAVVRTGTRAAMVFDVGEDAADIDECLSAMRIETIPLMVLSHFDLDHVGGLVGALDGREVKRVLVSPLRDPAANAARVRDELSAHGVTGEPGAAGMGGEIGSVMWRLVWPGVGDDADSGVVVGTGTASNEAGLVAYVTVGGTRIMFPADLDAATQSAMRRRLNREASGVPAADVLVVAHHGSADQDPGFNKVLAPRVAIISVGADNDYGHPAPSTLAMLHQIGAPVFRTDQCGSIAVTVRPELAVTTEHECQPSP